MVFGEAHQLMCLLWVKMVLFFIMMVMEIMMVSPILFGRE